MRPLSKLFSCWELGAGPAPTCEICGSESLIARRAYQTPSQQRTTIPSVSGFVPVPAQSKHGPIVRRVFDLPELRCCIVKLKRDSKLAVRQKLRMHHARAFLQIRIQI